MKSRWIYNEVGICINYMVLWIVDFRNLPFIPTTSRPNYFTQLPLLFIHQMRLLFVILCDITLTASGKWPFFIGACVWIWIYSCQTKSTTFFYYAELLSFFFNPREEEKKRPSPMAYVSSKSTHGQSHSSVIDFIVIFTICHLIIHRFTNLKILLNCDFCYNHQRRVQNVCAHF